MPATNKLQRTNQDENLDSLTVWVSRFLRDRRTGGVAKRTELFYSQKLGQFLAFCKVENLSFLEEITPESIRSFMEWLEGRGNNAGGRHAAYRTLKVFLYWLWDELEISLPCPIRKVKAPRVPTEPLDPVSADTVKAMLAACNPDSFTGTRDRALILFLLDTGARANECLHIELDDIDLWAGSALIRQGKGHKPRMVYFGKTTRKALKVYLKARGGKAGALWRTRQNSDLSYDGLRQALKSRAIQAGVKPPSPHDFRRAFALAMLRAGVDLLSIQRLLGHSSLAVLQRYIKQTDLDGMNAHAKGSPVENL